MTTSSPKRVLSFDMGSRNMAYAVVEQPHTLVCWGMIDLGVNQARQATENLIRLLESPDYRWMRECAYGVVVEQQPANGTCKILAHALQVYFMTADIMAGREPRLFHFMAPHNKLKFDPRIYDSIRPETHAQRKLVSMRVVYEYVDRESTMYTFYQSRNNKQQTDLADAYIQGCRELQGACGSRVQFRPSQHSDRVEAFDPKTASVRPHDVDWDVVDFI